jgi:hypothetical protein
MAWRTAGKVGWGGGPWVAAKKERMHAADLPGSASVIRARGTEPAFAKAPALFRSSGSSLAADVRDAVAVDHRDLPLAIVIKVDRKSYRADVEPYCSLRARGGAYFICSQFPRLFGGFHSQGRGHGLLPGSRLRWRALGIIARALSVSGEC